VIEEGKKKQVEEYNAVVNASDDLIDVVHDLTKHIHEFTESTGVYFGVLERPLKEIADDSTDVDHIDEGA
jgi:hypothetical protein